AEARAHLPLSARRAEDDPDRLADPLLAGRVGELSGRLDTKRELPAGAEELALGHSVALWEVETVPVTVRSPVTFTFWPNTGASSIEPSPCTTTVAPAATSSTAALPPARTMRTRPISCAGTSARNMRSSVAAAGDSVSIFSPARFSDPGANTAKTGLGGLSPACSTPAASLPAKPHV